MTARHSIYKKQSRWNKATEVEKTRSSFQRKINNRDKEIAKLVFRSKCDQYTLKKHGELFNKLVTEGLVSKEYCKPYLPRKKDVKRMFKIKEVKQ
jgi:hypothetical protein